MLRPFINLSNYFEVDCKLFSSLFSKQNFYRKKSLQSPQNSRDLEIKSHLLSLLRRNDRMSMANSVEIRAPFLDINLAYFALKKISHKTSDNSKKFLRAYLKNNLPSFKTDKEKIGFYVPFDNWFQLNQNNVEVKNILERSKTFLYENYNLKILRNDKYDGRLGWILCNLGIFLENFNYER